MRTIGLLGGMSWESTVPYYQIVNRVVARELGGLNSARVVMHSVNFAEIVDLPKEGRWDEAGAHLARAARPDFLVLCVNTLHRVADQIERDGGLPVLHILEPTAAAIHAAGIGTVGVLGTRFVMEDDFYRGRLERVHGVRVIVPADEADRAFVHRIIYEELARGILSAETRARCGEIIAALAARGAQGVVLACTELPLLLSSRDAAVPLFATTNLHAEAAALSALGRWP